MITFLLAAYSCNDLSARSPIDYIGRGPAFSDGASWPWYHDYAERPGIDTMSAYKTGVVNQKAAEEAQARADAAYEARLESLEALYERRERLANFLDDIRSELRVRAFENEKPTKHDLRLKQEALVVAENLKKIDKKIQRYKKPRPTENNQTKK